MEAGPGASSRRRVSKPAAETVAAQRPGVNSNLLTGGTPLDPLSGNAVLNGIPVTVTRSPAVLPAQVVPSPTDTIACPHAIPLTVLGTLLKRSAPPSPSWPPPLKPQHSTP